LDQTSKTLRAAELDVLCHRDLPPNDGGLAAGQALGALWDITSVSP
jgi:hydrogenase maturation factor HypF (carbamoyltransferase family)